MLRHFRKYGGGGRAVAAMLTSAMPLVIIGGLLYAGLFVKAEAVVQRVEPPTIERRDRFYGVAAPTESVVWVAGATGKIVRSEDGGRTWNRQATHTDVNLQGIAAWDGQQAVAAGDDGVIIRTSDGGQSWSPADVPAQEGPNKLFRARVFGERAWAVGEFNTLLRSDDRGATWSRVLPKQDRAWNDVTFVGEHGWLVGEFGTVMKSSDGGQNWAEVSFPGEAGNNRRPSLMGVAFRDERHGVAVGLSGTLLTTADGGLTWTVVPPLTREHLLAVMWDEDRWLAVGDKGVMVTAPAAADQWQLSRVAASDVSWRTQVARSGSRYYLVGSNLGVLENGSLSVAGQAVM